VSSLVLKFTIPTGFFDTTLFAILAVWTTLLAATTAMISNPHVALNRERKGGIVKFIVVGSETKNKPSAGRKSPKPNTARNLAEKSKIEGISRKVKREGIVIKTAGRH
jgi:hypothetical protein